MLASKALSSSMQIGDGLNMFERYAIYYLPVANQSLVEFARNWFGYDHYNQRPITSRTTYGLNSELLDRVTLKPKRYSMHATLKAPFYMDKMKTQDMLLKRLQSFSSNRKKFVAGSLQITQIGNCLALTLAGDNRKINQFASQCVLGFDEFRAPISVVERTRRLETGLTTHQRLMLEAHGYPYVLSEFQFHITLTSGLTQDEVDQVTLALEPILAELNNEPLIIDSICLMGDPGSNNPFHIIENFALAS